MIYYNYYKIKKKLKIPDLSYNIWVFELNEIKKTGKKRRRKQFVRRRTRITRSRI